MSELSKGLDSISQRASRHRSRFPPYLGVGDTWQRQPEVPPPSRIGRVQRPTSWLSCRGGWARPNGVQGGPDEVCRNCQKVLGAVDFTKYLHVNHCFIKTGSITKSN